MDSKNNLFFILIKSSLIATCMFWLLVFQTDFDSFLLMMVLISVIPITIISSLTILGTIMPFYWFNINKLNKYQIFKKYFPVYSITIFTISCYYVIISKYDHFVLAFCLTAFFTLMQAWVYIFKIKKQTKPLLLNQ